MCDFSLNKIMRQSGIQGRKIKQIETVFNGHASKRFDK